MNQPVRWEDPPGFGYKCKACGRRLSYFPTEYCHTECMNRGPVAYEARQQINLFPHQPERNLP
jgi:hypothetical protein